MNNTILNKLEKSSAVIRTNLLHCYFEIVRKTSKFHTNKISNLIEETKQSNSFIWVIWHHQSLLHMLLPSILDINIYAFFSDEPAADTYANLVSKLGHILIRPDGKTMPDFLKTVAEILSAKGNIIGIAADGPFGPRCLAKPWIVRLAKSSGACIIPFHCKVKTAWTDKGTWDQRLVPTPFNDFYYSFATPIQINPNASGAEILRTAAHLQNELARLESTD